MIIRKPFAFLIKNFKKIHILLLVLSLFVAYKIFDVSTFVNEFMRLGTYDLYADPITNHISMFLIVSVIILIVGSASLIILLKYKGKPWKTYLIPFILYLSIFFILNMIKGFFRTYTVDVETTDLRMSRDLLMMLIIGQLPAIGIFAMRTFGLDINKFNFNSDQEFLELSEEDREEIEISFDVDVNTFKRLFKRLRRNISYFYKEHKLISKLVIAILVLILGFNTYNFWLVKHKSYNQGDSYNYNGFVINVDDSFVTNKDGRGNVISKKSKFVIVRFTVKNNVDETRKFDTSNLHVKAGNLDFSTTETTYSKEFSDLGKSYSKVKSMKKGETLTFIVIYKVDNDIKNDRFVLYFQEKDKDNILRKIKLNIKDISQIDKAVNYKFGDSIKIELFNNSDMISFDDVEISEIAEVCDHINCQLKGINSNEYKIMTLEFASENWESKNMIDFLSMYGKISYKDNDGEDQVEEILSAVKNKYLGKVVYLLISNEAADANTLHFDFVVRNREYIYGLK